MDEQKIIEMYWNRDRAAVEKTSEIYGSCLIKLANNILADEGDAQDVVNDTYMKMWETIPPCRPQMLSVYLSKRTRQTAMDMQRRLAKVRKTQYIFAAAELDECVTGKEETQRWTEFLELTAKLNSYIKKLSPENRNLFLCRYYYFDSLQEIVRYSGLNEVKIRNIMYRIRTELRVYLIKEELNDISSEKILDAIGKADDSLIREADVFRDGHNVPDSKQKEKIILRKRWIRTGLLLIILVWMFLSFCLFADKFSFNNMLAYAQTLQYL